MITLDNRTPNEKRGGGDHIPEYQDLHHYLGQWGTPSTLSRIEFGDAMWLGHGPADIPVLVGAELSKVPDAVGKMLSGRFSGHQLPGLLRSYQYRYFIIEGEWRCSKEGALVVPRGSDWTTPGAAVSCAGFARWLTTMTIFCGVQVIMTRDRRHTAWWLSNLYAWWSKSWHEHSAHLGIEEFEAAPQEHIELKAPDPVWDLTFKWASAVPAIGRVKAKSVADYFSCAGALASCTLVKQWMEIKGIGKGIGQSAIELIAGKRPGR